MEEFGASCGGGGVEVLPAGALKLRRSLGGTLAMYIFIRVRTSAARLSEADSLRNETAGHVISRNVAERRSPDYESAALTN